jgi:hypothetical protein
MLGIYVVPPIVRIPALVGVAPERVEVTPLMTATVEPDPVLPMLIVVPEIVAAAPPGVRVVPATTNAPAEFAVTVWLPMVRTAGPVGEAAERLEVTPLMTATVEPDPDFPMLIVEPEIVAAAPPGVRVVPATTNAPAEFAVTI